MQHNSGTGTDQGEFSARKQNSSLIQTVIQIQSMASSDNDHSINWFPSRGFSSIGCFKDTFLL